MNIFHNFIPNKIINCSYKYSPWITDDIKSRLRKRSKMTKKCYKYGKMKCHLDELQEKTILNNRKIPAIPPLLVNGDIITNFPEKADRLN